MHFNPQQKPLSKSAFADIGFIYRETFGLSYEYFNTEAERSQYIANHKLIINLKSENYA